MNRSTALALVAVLWAAIYLPGLGSTEIKGEEGRRILPAVTMLETGNWLVPYIGGEPYLRKPPLVNWAIAGMFKLTGVRNEWTARLPSAFCVLALGLCIVLVAQGRASPGRWLDVETSLIAAVMAMTQFGLLAKAKFAGAEIEGIYAPLTGIAIVAWLAWHTQGRSPWLVWTVPGIFLGLACLAKGPSLHLLFYYVIVLAVLWREKALRQFLHPAHFLGVAICAGIFAAWAVPYFQTPEAATAAEVWKRQGLDRFTDSDFNAVNYFTNLPRALADQLPWILLAPVVILAWRRKRDSGVPPEVADHRRGTWVTFWPLLVCFVGVLLVPGTLPRYVLPLGAPIALLLAENLVKSGRFGAPGWLVIKCGALIGVAMILYAAAIVPQLRAHDNIRPIAAEVDATIPPGNRLTIYDPGYLAAIFYLRTPYDYAPQLENLPADAVWVLARGGAREKLAKKRPELRVEREIPGKGGLPLLLLHRADGIQKVRTQ